MNMREYLCRASMRNMEKSLTGLPEAYEEATRDHRRTHFYQMMGISHLMNVAQRTPPSVDITGELTRPGYKIQKLYFESIPGLYVTCNLYMPESPGAPTPGILYLCGHQPPQKVAFQTHARRFAEMGFTVLVMETIQRGEIGGHHNGPRFYEWFHWYSRGYTAGGVELWNSIRALDLLESLPEVNKTKLGVTGLSGGGAGSWWLSAADDRIKAAAAVCGTYSFSSHVCDRTVDVNCDCMFPINYYGWEFSDIGALVAPRPFLIAAATKDSCYTKAGTWEVYKKLRVLYEAMNSGEALRWLETPGPHSYQLESGRAVFVWFMRHLQGKQVSESDVPALDERPEVQETEESLRVFIDGIPHDQQVTSIHEAFIPLATAPEITDKAQLAEERQRVTKSLRELSFHHFPRQHPPLKLSVSFETETRTDLGGEFRFQSEEDVWLTGSWSAKVGAPEGGPACLLLRSPDEKWRAGERWLSGLPARWTRLVVDSRGTGEHSWSPQIDTHLRRAAMLAGRTIPSLQVYDALRALQAIKELPGIGQGGVVLAGRGPMAVIALYAALLSDDVQAVVLEDPPATQNESLPGTPGSAGEMLGVLQITDLPQIAALLWPTELVFVGGRPQTYRWTEDLYRRLGPPGKVRHLPSLSDWEPEPRVVIGDHLAPRSYR